MNPQPVLAEIAIKALTVLGGGEAFGLTEASARREKRQMQTTRHKRKDHNGFISEPIFKISGSVLFRVD